MQLNYSWLSGDVLVYKILVSLKIIINLFRVMDNVFLFLVLFKTSELIATEYPCYIDLKKIKVASQLDPVTE